MIECEPHPAIGIRFRPVPDEIITETGVFRGFGEDTVNRIAEHFISPLFEIVRRVDFGRCFRIVSGFGFGFLLFFYYIFFFFF